MGKVQDKYNEVKSWYQSKTIIGLIISSISGVIYALSKGAIDVQGATDQLLNADEVVKSADDIWIAITFFVGQAVSLYGRLKAKLGIKL